GGGARGGGGAPPAARRGAPAALAWHPAGTTLLAVPASAVASAVGPLSGPPPAERAELDALLAESPAFDALTVDDRLGLVSRAHPSALPPGAPVVLPSAGDVLIVTSGVIRLYNGAEVGRGVVIGPGTVDQVGTARTAARVWTLPAL